MSYINREAFIKDQCNLCDGWCDVVDCDCLNCCHPEHRCDMIACLAEFPAAKVYTESDCNQCMYKEKVEYNAEEARRDWGIFG